MTILGYGAVSYLGPGVTSEDEGRSPMTISLNMLAVFYGYDALLHFTALRSLGQLLGTIPRSHVEADASRLEYCHRVL